MSSLVAKMPTCMMHLDSLKKGRHKDPMTIRVIRKWTVRETTGQCAPLYIGMVLTDAKGTPMYAEIPQDTIPKLEHLLDIGKVYAISKFKVTNAKTTYRPFDASLMMELTDFSVIELRSNPSPTIPQYVYNLTPFPSIVPVERAVFTYTDVIGYITKYTTVKSFVPKGKEMSTILREVYLKDLSDRQLKVTLWGDHATSFNISHVYDSSAGNIVVCLLLGTIPRRVYNDYDTTYLSGSAACSLQFNPAIPEAEPFYSRFKDIPIYIECPDPSIEQIPAQVQEKPKQQKTLAELNEVDPFDFEDADYKCAVTITSVGNNNNWWYMSCKPCKKAAVRQADNTYKCPKCDGFNIIPRYMLPFIARDVTAECRFFAYDEEAKQIVQKDCDAIMNPLTIGRGLPQPLQDIIGKAYVFSVDLTYDSCSLTRGRQYLVKSVLERPTRRHPAVRAAASASSSRLADPTHTGLPAMICSSTPMRSSQAQPETLQIQASGLQTPVPSIVLDESPSKNREASGACRSLAGALDGADKEPSYEDGASATTPPAVLPRSACTTTH